MHIYAKYYSKRATVIPDDAGLAVKLHGSPLDSGCNNGGLQAG